MNDLWRRNAIKLGEEQAKEHFCSLPVDPIKLAEKMNIVVEPLPPDRKTVSGILVYVNNVFGIKYATYIDNQGFQNFCVAHELGHYFLPEHPEKLLLTGVHESHAGFSSADRCELEADHFAAGLLMPAFLFDPLLNKLQSGLRSIETLSRACGTSLTATAIRYAERTADPVAIILSEGASICYCFMSDAMRGIRELSWLKKGLPVPRNTVTYRFNKTQNNILKGSLAEGGTSFSDWFGCDLSYELYEEVKGLGGYGKTLTVLTVDEVLDQDEMDEEDDLIESWTPRFRR